MSQSNQSAEAAKTAHEWLVGSGLYRNVIDSAGEYDSKIETEENTSLAAHILNAVTVAVNSFVYEAFSPGDNIQDYEEDIKVLAAATALHDTNKFVQEAYGFDTEGNTEEAFSVYFGEHDDVDNEGDDFCIKSDFLGPGYRDDLLYIVQRCEIGENSAESRRTDTDFRGLERYCRIGDQVASIAQREGIRGVSQKLTEKFSEADVHLLMFSALEQPVLNELLIGAVKQTIAGENGYETSGVVIGSTSESVVYLGDEVERQEVRSSVETVLLDRVTTGEFEFSPKLNDRSFEYDVLDEVGIPFEEKEKSIAKTFRDRLESGIAGLEPFEHIPEEFNQHFPVLAKCLYLDDRSEFEDESLQEAYDQIDEDDDIWGGNSEIHLIAHLLRDYKRYQEPLKQLSEEIRPKLRDDLEPEGDAIGTVVNRFFNLDTDEELAESKEKICFLCGREARSVYQKGARAIYRTYEYSRRLPPHDEYKSICEVCNLEYALFSDICERNGVSTANSVETAYFYFDDFLGDVRVRGRRVGSVIQDETVDIDNTEVATSLVGPQYYLQPFYINGGQRMSDENHRMLVVRRIMQAAQQSGMKVVIGRPFTRFDSADEVFADEEATRPQELLGLDEVERFGPLPEFVNEENRTDSHLKRALALFKIMSMVGQDANMRNQYLQLDRDTFHSIANFAVVNHDSATVLPDLREYFQAYHANELMQMKTIAERGIDLFGKQYDSKYKKTKVFREALDAFLSGKNQNMPDERLVEYVESQVYAAADREDYAGRVTTEQAEAFVEAIQSYLVENDLYDLKKLSDWEDALVNSYYYAYDQLLYDDQ
jgi:CRISPR-associated protein Csc3